jgi:hypothetical protein
MRMPEPDIQSVEAALTALYSADRNDLNELTISPPAQTVMSFCAEAAMLQFVITWARRVQGLTVAVFPELDANSENFESRVQKQLGFPYVLAAWVFAGELSGAKGSALKRREAKSFAAFLDAMDNFEFLSTHETAETRANLVCVQGSKREFIRPFYESFQNRWRVRPEGDVRVVIQDILAQLSGEWKGKYLRELSEPLAHFIRELVENSDWWARTDHRGVEYEKGIRAVTLRVLNIDNDNLAMFAGNTPYIHSYLRENLIDHPRVRVDDEPGSRGLARYLSFIELTMVDSGPGLAWRWLSSRPEKKLSEDDLAKLTPEEEEEAVIECFMKWKTTSGNSLRGVGLFSVASLLQSKNGFLRLRTGRLSFLFGTRTATTQVELHLKNLDLSVEYHKLKDGTHVFLQDKKLVFFLVPWSDEALSPVEGTAYSILLPV